MILNQVNVAGASIPDTWFRTLKACLRYGRVYTIDKGEYQDQQRLEMDLAIIHIKSPWLRPLACEAPGWRPTTEEKIQKYFYNYILNSEFDDPKEAELNEYKYASWIAPQWQHCCDLLLHGKGGCNQATISIGKGPDDWSTFDKPPCLRMIDMRILEGRLHFFVTFRSWDLVGGFPENLGGIQLLKEWCLDYLNSEGAKLKDGSIVGISKGLHIYDHYWTLAEDFVGEWVPDGICLIEVGD